MERLYKMKLGCFLFLFSLAMSPAFSQEFCTCNLQRETDWDSDTLLYSVGLTVFPESRVYQFLFAVAQDEEKVYYIQSDISDKQYVFYKADRSVEDQWGSFGYAVSVRKALLEIVSKDMFGVQCPSIYLDNKTYDFSSILTYNYHSPYD
uniref:Secreted protein n=1 Tax=Roseihalotalea indica TaxID=2867963 RepID=A0AA49GKN8_9BACT|nr:hypothetical protein K4G66_24430 [Tunicatimonas sp. TK19036]